MQEVGQRKFELPLSNAYAVTLGTYALVFRHLIERVGPDETCAIWEQVPSEADSLTQEILSLEVGIESKPLANAQIGHHIDKIFARPVRGFGAEQAMTFLCAKPPFTFIKEAVPTIQGVLSLTTYQSLHLCRDALARIAEETISRFGKAGELMLYDALLSDPEPPANALSADAFMQQRLSRYQNPPNVPDIFSAGLDIELVQGDAREIVAHVTQCEWARYYLERHPSVGYLLACSTDDPIYREQCADVRFQRRCTLMEAGAYCEFDFYRL